MFNVQKTFPFEFVEIKKRNVVLSLVFFISKKQKNHYNILNYNILNLLHNKTNFVISESVLMCLT